MTPPERRGQPIRARRAAVALRALLLVGLFAALVAAWQYARAPQRARSAALLAHPRPDRSRLDPALLSAIRDGDHAKVKSLLEQGAHAGAYAESGETALLRAALDADTEMMRLLLERGAEVNARAPDGATALLRSVHDVEKVRLLLDHGALVDDRIMVAAARVPGSRATLELLLGYEGSGAAQVQGYTALMAAAGNGELDAVTCLLRHGADARARTPNGYTAMHAAASAGNAAVVKQLLDRGADPGGVCELVDSNGNIQTPAMAAALLGHADCLGPILAKGADVNVQGGPFQRSALLDAVTTGNEEVVRLLLARGANVHAEDSEGASPLDWAERRGPTRIVQLLREAGATESAPPRPARPRSRVPRARDAGAVRQAVAASLPPLQRSGRQLTETKGCVTCHQHALLAMTVGLARQYHVPVDEAIASRERAHVLSYFKARIRPLLLGGGVDATLIPYTLVGLAALDQEPNPVTDALVHYLTVRQQQDGHWQTENYRPPEDASDFLFTALAVRGLQRYAPPGRTQEMAARIARARAWLRDAPPRDTTDQVFQLLGLGWAQGDSASIRKAADALLHQQRPDGGWAQLPTLASDAYATGTVLYALHEGAGLRVDHPAYQRGVAFLLETQRTDGSWLVKSRSFPTVRYSSSGFPHGRSQFISAAATCWATMALTFCLPPLRAVGEKGDSPLAEGGRSPWFPTALTSGPQEAVPQARAPRLVQPGLLDGASLDPSSNLAPSG